MGCGWSQLPEPPKADAPAPSVPVTSISITPQGLSVPAKVASPKGKEESKDREFDYLYKYVLLGEPSVGKTSLMMRFVLDDFGEYTSTVGVDFKIKTIEVDGLKVKLQIWDTAGQDRYHAITKAYYRGAFAFLLLFDLSNAETWSSIPRWVQRIEDNASESRARFVVALVGNKADMEPRAVHMDEVEAYARQIGAFYFETSAKSSLGVNSLFQTVTQEVKRIQGHI